MDIILSIPILAGFFIALFFIPIWIRKARQIGLIWDDKNKIGAEKVAGSGGIIIISSFIISLFIFVAYRTFYLKDTAHLIEIISLATVIILSAGIGFIDDLMGWQRGGLSIRTRLILVAISAIPLMAINAGRHIVSLPFFGIIDFGIIYPLLLIPLGIVATTTTFNFLAGFNGLEAGQGIIMLSALGAVAYFTGNPWLAVINFCMVAVLFAFLFYNFSPAKVFPGDVMTYGVGSLIGITAILGNFEKIAIFFFMPYIIEIILKSRGRLIKASFGKPRKDGSLEMPYDKIYGMTHLGIWVLKSLNIKPTEKRVVYLIWGFQIFIILLGLIIFGKGIF